MFAGPGASGRKTHGAPLPENCPPRLAEDGPNSQAIPMRFARSGSAMASTGSRGIRVRLRTEGGERIPWRMGPVEAIAVAREHTTFSVLGALNTDDPKSEIRNLAAAEGRDEFSAISAVNERCGPKHLDRGLGGG